MIGLGGEAPWDLPGDLPPRSTCDDRGPLVAEGPVTPPSAARGIDRILKDRQLSGTAPADPSAVPRARQSHPWT